MDEVFREIASSGSMLLAVPLAVLAGGVSFFSPCVLPLLPGYLSYATGLSGTEVVEGPAPGRQSGRARMLTGTVLFVLGFTVVFLLLGALFGAAGAWLQAWQREITVVLGGLTIVLGLVFCGLVPWLQREWRLHRVPAVGLAAAPVLGFLFGLGWTPCIGPTLGAILTLSFQEATAMRGLVLSGFYALGLGLPFLLVGLLWRRALTAFAVIRRHQTWVTVAGGVMLVAIGVLLVTGWWDWMVTWLQVRLVSDFQVAV